MASTLSQELAATGTELFTECADAFLQDVFPLFDNVVYLPWEILKTSGSVQKYIWIVESGSVRVVDGKDTVLRTNGVVGMHALVTPSASVGVYTVYATRQGAVCMRIALDSLKCMLRKHPQDKALVMRNGLKYATRRPQGDIVLAMQRQVANRGNVSAQFSTTISQPSRLPLFRKQTYSKRAGNVLQYIESTTADTEHRAEMDAADSLTAVIHSQMDRRRTHLTGDTTHSHPENTLTLFRKTHSKSVGNVLESREPTFAPRRNIRMTTNAETLQKTPRHSGSSPQTTELATLHRTRCPSDTSISGGALFYANVVYDCRRAAEHGGIVESARLTIRRTSKNVTIACVSLLCLPMFVLCLAIFPFECQLFLEPWF